MNLDKYTFEQLLGALGKKLDNTNFVKFSITTNIQEEPPVIVNPPVEDKPTLVTDNKYVTSSKFIGVIKNKKNENENLFIVTFDDTKSRLYSVDSKGVISNKGSNILQHQNVLALDYDSYNLIKTETGSNGLDPDPLAAKL